MALRRRQPLRPALPRFPRTAEREFRRMLFRRLRRARGLMLAAVRPELAEVAENEATRGATVAEILARVVQSPHRADAPGDDAARLARLVEAVKLSFEVAFPPNVEELAAFASGVDRFATRQSVRVVEEVAAISPAPTQTLRETHLAWARGNAELIESLSTEYMDQAAEVIARGVQEGLSTEAIAGELEQRFQVARSRARLIARDQVATLNAQITQRRQTESGIIQYRWITALDERVRPEHQERHGQIFLWQNPPPDGHPGEPINCRCIAEPVV